MILQLENWHFGYSQILDDCLRSEDGTVWILCNADVDAMAAARILCFMLRSDGITYQLRPCTSYSALVKVLRDQHHDDVCALVLLNLGASRNLTKLFHDEEPAALSPLTRVYVMDCRRPFHLANVHAKMNVVLFWDDTQTEIPSDGDNLSGNESTSSEEEEEEESESESEEEAEFDDGHDEGEQEFDEGGGVEREISKPPVREDRDYDGEDEDEGVDEDEDVGSQSRRRSRHSSTEEISGVKRQKTDRSIDADDASFTTKEGGSDEEGGEGEPEKQEESLEQPAAFLSPRELHRQRRNRLRMYYSGGSFYGTPAAYVAYRISTQLRFGEVGDLLWLACVGVTDAFLHSRLDVAGYTALAMDLKRYCLRLFPNDMYHRVGNTVYAEHLAGRSNSNNDGGPLTNISLSENGRILAENDFRFFLLRHTSLFDSMIHSNYISTKLQLWTKKGMQNLQELLAKMGCSLEQCRQPYTFMSPKVRRSLREKLEMYSEDYNLGTFEFTSFKLVTGYKSLLSASDMSLAVSALLEDDTQKTTSSATMDGEKAEDKSTDQGEAIQAFNSAYDALNCSKAPSLILSEGSNIATLVNGGDTSGISGLGAGLKLAMALQKNIISTAVSLVDRNAITRLRHFRYAYITFTSQDGPSDEGSDQSHAFAKPLALTRLAHYLMDMHRENGKWTGTKARPLVLLAEKPQTATYVVVGYEYPEQTGDFVRNRFGQNFELAAKTMKGTFRFDSFDSNVVEVDAKDVQRFVEQLHYMMDST